jgi:hypothetical protein
VHGSRVGGTSGTSATVTASPNFFLLFEPVIRDVPKVTRDSNYKVMRDTTIGTRTLCVSVLPFSRSG